jgi:SnoaL-like domain
MVKIRAPGRDGSFAAYDPTVGPEMTSAERQIESVADRLDRLERRVAQLEDEAEIARLIASYGPLADSSQGDAVQAMWVEEGGTYELQGYHFTSADMAATVTSDLHRRFVSRGSAHTLGPPRIWLDGDTAVVVNYSVVLVHDDGRWVAERVAANRWDITRTADGWRVRRRVNRLLDGSPDAVAILAGHEPPRPNADDL